MREHVLPGQLVISLTGPSRLGGQMTDAMERIRKLAEVLADQDSDSDDLIHAFGDVEELRYEVADALLKLLQTSEEETHAA